MSQEISTYVRINLNNSKKPQSIKQPLGKQLYPNIAYPSHLQQTLKSMQDHVQSQIQSGTLSINLQSTPLSSSSISSQKSLSQSPKPFYTSSNPSVIRQKYSQLLKLKQEYSHPRNQQTMKEMQEVVRSWMKRQKVAQKKRQQVKERMEKQQVQEMEREEEKRRKSLESKLEQYKKRLGDKIQDRKLRKVEEKSLMEADSISKQMLKNKQPLYKQKQKEFHQHQSFEREAQNMQLYWKKQSLSPYNFNNLKQHRLKIAQQLNRQTQQRHQTAGSPRRLKTQSLLSLNNTRTQFITTKNDRFTIKQQQQKKRLRIKQYVRRLKSMSPDQATLERINKVKEQIVSSQKLLHQNIMRRIERTDRKVRKNNLSVKNLTREVQKKLTREVEKVVQKHRVSKQERIQMGNIQMKQKDNQNMRKGNKNFKTENKNIKTENRNNDTIEENPEESFSLDHQKAKQVIQTQQKKYSKPKTQTTQQATPNTLPLHNPLSTRKHKSKSLKTLPNPNVKPLLPQNRQTRPQYKNYLPQVKQKIAHSQSSIEKAKKGLKYPQQIFREFGKQSLQLEKKLIKKINEFKRIQLSENYEKNLIKETEIDELYHKNLQMKLACLAID